MGDDRPISTDVHIITETNKDLEQLPPKISQRKRPTAVSQGLSPPLAKLNDGNLISSSSAAGPRDIAEKEALVNALRQTKGNQSQAARILGINRVTVWNRMKKYGIDLKRVLTTQN